MPINQDEHHGHGRTGGVSEDIQVHALQAGPGQQAKFAATEGKLGGQFYTAQCVVRLLNMEDWGYSKVKNDVPWRRFDQSSGNAQFSLPPGGQRKQKDGSFVHVDGGNANYAWILHFLHHLAPHGTAGFVLANGSLTSNTSGEDDIGKAIIEADMVAEAEELDAAIRRNLEGLGYGE